MAVASRPSADGTTPSMSLVLLPLFFPLCGGTYSWRSAFSPRERAARSAQHGLTRHIRCLRCPLTDLHSQAAAQRWCTPRIQHKAAPPLPGMRRCRYGRAKPVLGHPVPKTVQNCHRRASTLSRLQKTSTTLRILHSESFLPFSRYNP